MCEWVIERYEIIVHQCTPSSVFRSTVLHSGLQKIPRLLIPGGGERPEDTMTKMLCLHLGCKSHKSEHQCIIKLCRDLWMSYPQCKIIDYHNFVFWHGGKD